MPKAVLEFNLPDENAEFRSSLDGPRWQSAMWDLDQELRSKAKHGAGDEAKWAQKWREALHAILNEAGLQFDE